MVVAVVVMMMVVDKWVDKVGFDLCCKCVEKLESSDRLFKQSIEWKKTGLGVDE